MSDNRTSNQHYFLSYSRRQFYFAESVVLNLQEAGFDIWFDVQELAPGEVWRNEIERGIAEAHGCIVIVSQASMASPYVRKEWEPMLPQVNEHGIVVRAGKPIYLVIFEGCDVPPELEQNAILIIDMRGNFRRNMKKLVRALRGETVKGAPNVPKYSRFGIPRRLPLTIGLILGLLGVSTALLIFMAIASFFFQGDGVYISTLIMSGLWAYFITRTTVDYLRREYSFRQMWLSILILLPLAYLFPVLIPFPVLALVIYFIAPGSYRWLPTGQAPAWMRERFGTGNVPTIHEALDGLDEKQDPEQARYTIQYAPADEWIAKKIETVLEKGGHQRVPPEGATANTQHILIVSNLTPVALAEQMLELHSADKLTPVLVSNVDAREAVDKLGEFQFIDFRQHDDKQLEAISLLFRHPEEGKIAYGMNVLPVSSKMLQWPTGVRRFNTINHLIFLLFTLMVVGFVVPETTAILSGAYGFHWLTSLIVTVYLLMIIGHVWIADRVQKRAVTFQGYQRRMLVLMIVGIMSLLFAIPQLILYFSSRHALRKYLPTEKPRRNVARFPHASQGAAVNRALRDASILAAFVVTLYVDEIMTVL